MTINDIIQGFNSAIDEIRGNEEGYFLTSVTSIIKKIGAIKTITIELYLVNKSNKDKKIIAKEQFTGEITDACIDSVIDRLSVYMVSAIALLIKDHSQELIDGTYGTE